MLDTFDDAALTVGAGVEDGPPQHYDSWLTNHGYVEHLGLAAAALAVCDELPEATAWILGNEVSSRQPSHEFFLLSNPELG